MFQNSFGVVVRGLSKDIQIELNSPVVDITIPADDDVDGLVRLRTTHGTTYFAKQLVVTSSPHVLKSGVMKFHPPLSSEINDALDSVTMHSIVKVILKFSKAPWPKDVHGMIMTDENFLIPEIWFHDCTDQAAEDEPAKAYAVGFTTSERSFDACSASAGLNFF
jgi:monoamine oxidase